MAKVSTSASEARALRILDASDGITMNRDRLLSDAKAQALRMAEGATRRRDADGYSGAGRGRAGDAEAGRVHDAARREYISDHDVKIANWWRMCCAAAA